MLLTNIDQGIDEAEYGGAWELTKEGFLTSAAGFLVTWIIVYTGLHIDQIRTPPDYTVPFCVQGSQKSWDLSNHNEQ